MTLGDVLDLLVGLLLRWLLGSGSSGVGWGRRGITLGMRIGAPIYHRVFAIPLFERDQYAHVQMSEKVGGRSRVWGRKVLRKVK